MPRLLATLPWCVLVSTALAASPRIPRVALDVPIVTQERERCGPAALAMVLGYYHADSAAVREAERAYDPVLRGSLITELAAAARRAGFDAFVATLTPDSLIGLVQGGVPPIVLYQNGPAPLTRPHFGVVIAWDPARDSFTLLDGRDTPVEMRADRWVKRWRPAGSQALVVRRRSP